MPIRKAGSGQAPLRMGPGRGNALDGLQGRLQDLHEALHPPFLSGGEDRQLAVTPTGRPQPLGG
jgi:hypothetical protein